MSSTRCLIAALAFALIPVCSSNAATVGFYGTFDSGTAGPLGSLPRDFVLTLDYSPSMSGLANTTGTFDFAASGPDPAASYATSGGMVIEDNTGAGGTDVFRLTGLIAAGDFGPTQVNYSFEFLNPAGTVNSVAINEASIQALIGGQATISFVGSGTSVSGGITGAPEPSSMIALTGLVIGGCGIGYRRRNKSAKDAEQDQDASDA